MSETKHTPGPWEVVAMNGFGPFAIRMDTPQGSKHPTHYGVGMIGTEANARLIAAAPDMAAELRHQLRNCPVCKGTRKAVDVIDMLTGNKPHKERECSRCASGWAALEKAGAA